MLLIKVTHIILQIIVIVIIFLILVYHYYLLKPPWMDKLCREGYKPLNGPDEIVFEADENRQSDRQEEVKIIL